jgi:hypothetical protein
VGINPILSDFKGPGTSKLDCRYLEHNKIDSNELQIRTNSQISALFLTQRPPDDWPDALDNLAIGLVANRYTKLGKTSEILLLSQGLSHIKIPLC